MITIATCLLFIACVYQRRKRYGFVVLIAVEWIALMAVYLYLQDDFVALSYLTDILIALMLASFMLGAVASAAVNRRAGRRWPLRISPLTFYVLALAAASATAVLVVLFDWRYVASYAALRSLLTDSGAESIPSFGVGLSFPVTMAALLVARWQGQRSLAFLFGVVGGVLALLTTSKIFLLLFVMFLLPVDLEWRAIRLARLLRYGIVAAVLVAALHLVLGKVVDTGDASLVRALVMTFASYIAGGIGGLELFVNGSAAFPPNALWQQFAVLATGIVGVPESPILPWIQVGGWDTNTYTAFAYWLDGLGIAGAAALAFGVGYLGGYLLSLDTLAGRFVSRFYVFCVLFMFHQDFFISAAVMWAVYLATSLLLGSVRTRQGLAQSATGNGLHVALESK